MPEPNNILLNVEGMTCSNCALTISRFLEKKGMDKVNVDFASGEVSFNNQVQLPTEEIAQGIESLGYHVKKENGIQEPFIIREWKKPGTKFWFCAAFTIPLMLHMVLPFHVLHSPVFQLILATPVLLVGCLYFGRSAYHSIKSGVPNMDVLIFMGSTAAYVYSFIGGVLLHNENYLFFETSAAIITLVLLGNWIEQRSVQQTRSAIKDLIKLQPAKAKLISFYGDAKFEIITEVEAPEIKKGHYLLVNGGDKIPADGEVVWGSGSVDESLITGESMPVEKSLTDGIPINGAYKDGTSTVIGGTTLVSGNMKIKATAVGNDSTLSQIIELVKNAQQNKPNIQKLADRITAWFVPAVITISIITFLLCWFVFNLGLQHAVMNSIAVLVISCPCAMGLATPTAVMVGIGRSAKNGILIKGSQTLETFSTIRQIVFDKTGTLTTGKFNIKELHAVNGTTAELKSIIGGLEKFSSHPIALSLQNELKGMTPLPFTSINEQKGIGISGEDNKGNKYELGSYSIAQLLTNDTTHNIYILKNNHLIGWVDIQDEIKPEAREVISFFKAQGIKTIMLSGDKKDNCKRVAEQIGIDEYHAQQLPKEKLAFIANSMKQAPTAMVGDGINDAPALTQATIGISLSNATQIAANAAQIILLNGNLTHLKNAYLVSKHSMLTIKQNLFWAFFYNVVAIPIAAAGFLSPMIGALSMAFSDVVVVGNSIRLRSKKLK